MLKLLQRIRIRKHSAKVLKHYELLNKAYKQYLGNVIQGSRTENEGDLLKYLNESIAFKNEAQVIDAGCGFGGPAKYFVEHNNINVTALTVSPQQQAIVTDLIKENGLSEQLTVVQADYHFLSDHFPANSIDTVYFLESFCHCYDPIVLLKEVKKVLKPGGTIYIKDYFINDSLPENKRHLNIISRLNRYYIFRFSFSSFGIKSFVSNAEAIGLKVEKHHKVKYAEDLQKVSEFHGFNNLNGDIDMGCQIDELFTLINVYEVHLKKV